MKLTADLFPYLLVPLLNLGANLSDFTSSPNVPAHDVIPSNGPLILGATATGSVAQAFFTHHPHHEPEREHEHSDRHRNENHHPNNGEGEKGMRRPKAGQKRVRVQSLTSHKRSETCPVPPVLSCSPQAEETDTCCVVNPGGVLVHTQFWDLGFGLANSWGIHGLWPDKCNNQFYENCDNSRAYSGAQIVAALQGAGQTNLIDFMNTHWVSNDESSPDFWSHEWKTHGTCVSTLEPRCFEDYQEAQEVVPYFETVVSLFQQLDTYKALTSSGIEPSESKTYTLEELQDAVTQSLGLVPDFICSESQLSSVQYYLNAQGPLQDGEFVASHASRRSECPKSGIKWLPKQLDN